MLDEFPDRFHEDSINVIHHPIFNFASHHPEKLNNLICFIGYKTKNKGFSDFIEIAKSNNNFIFLSIGGGRSETVGGQAVEIFSDNDTYLKKIAECTASVFPYQSGYKCSLSAAAFDALSCGVPILATNLPFFVNLNKYFGSSYVKVFNSFEDIGCNIKGHITEMQGETRQEKIKSIQHSKYGIGEVSKSFERLLTSI